MKPEDKSNHPILDAYIEKGGPSSFLNEILFTIKSGEFVGIIGPNGSGKTTLLRIISGITPYSGCIRIKGDSLQTLNARALSKILAVVPNNLSPTFGFSVEEVVMSGRHPHRGFLSLGTFGDGKKVARAMEWTGVTHLKKRAVTELSTGEFQRVLIARALAQDSPLLLLDEPTAHLDLAHQIGVFELLGRLVREEQKTIICACHDLNLASAHFKRLLLFSNGKLHADGTPSDVITSENLKSVFGADLCVESEAGTSPLIRFKRKSPTEPIS